MFDLLFRWRKAPKVGITVKDLEKPEQTKYTMTTGIGGEPLTRFGWVNNLKYGDKIIIKNGESYKIKKVDVVTTTHVSTQSSDIKIKYSRSTGMIDDGSGNDIKMIEPTEDMIDMMCSMAQRKTAMDIINQTEWKYIEIETLNKIAKTLNNSY